LRRQVGDDAQNGKTNEAPKAESSALGSKQDAPRKIADAIAQKRSVRRSIELRRTR